MKHERMRQGHVTKVVRIPGTINSPQGTRADSLQGYGIIRAEGRDVFFLGAAVVDNGFVQVEVGDAVCFTLEAGPLRRAAQVWIAPFNATPEANVKSFQFENTRRT